MLAHPQQQIPKDMEYTMYHVQLDRRKPSVLPVYFTDTLSAIMSSTISPSRSSSPADDPIGESNVSSPISPQQAGRFKFGQDFPSVPSARASRYIINSPSGPGNPDAGGHHPSDSPSPIDVQQVPSLSHPSSAPPSQDRFPHILEPLYTGADRTITDTNSSSERYSRTGQMDKYSGSLLDQRRMSEPASLDAPHSYQPNVHSTSHPSSLHSTYSPPHDISPSRSSSMFLNPALHRGASAGSLRDLRQQHFQYPPPQAHQRWKNGSDAGYLGPHSDDAVSPLQSSFGGDLVSSSTSMPYSPMNDNFYGPSPPGTATSATSSSGPLTVDGVFPSHPFSKIGGLPHRSASGPTHPEVDRKNYSFIALPGNTVKKRPRRRYDEIERLYQCSWPECTKAYGTLNHLNAHVTMQKHGPKRSPAEFKDLRKKWRAAKKEAESHMALNMRRGSYSSHHEDFDYDSRFAFSHSTQRNHSFHQQGMDFQPSLAMNHSLHPISTYSPHHRDDQSIDYETRRYNEILPSSWQEGSLTSRGLPEAFLPSLPSHHHLHHTQLPQLTITDVHRHHSAPMPSSPPRTIHQLPENSTLLTPLPGYQTPSFVHLSHAPPTYGGEGYDLCDESNSRPGTGSASASHPSSDEDHCF